MTALLNELCNVARLLDKKEVTKIWKNSKLGKIVRVNIKNITTISLTGNCKNGTRDKYGVYRFTTIVAGKSLCLYIGKGESTSIGCRWGSHFKSLRYLLNGKDPNESSAQKILSFMVRNKLTEMDVTIDYIEFEQKDKYLIHVLEGKSIEYLKPKLNFGHYVSNENEV